MNNNEQPKHTPEPWRENSQGDCEYINSVIHGAIATIPHGGLHRDEHKANARRIVACVNAMEGVEHPEKWRDIQRERIKEVVELRQQRDELIEALMAAHHRITEYRDGHVITNTLTNVFLLHVQRLIARVKGGAQ